MIFAYLLQASSQRYSFEDYRNRFVSKSKPQINEIGLFLVQKHLMRQVFVIDVIV
jgi:hypothetical protein